MAEAASRERSDALKNFTLFSYSLPASPISALGLPLVVHLPPFYAKEMGLGLALVGFLFMIARFWDVFTDPVLGILSDKFETRWGRRRHWIVLSVPILMLSAYMIFLPSGEVNGVYLMFWMFILYVGWTLLTISHLSWGAELTPAYYERSRVHGAREIALILGMVFVLTLPVFAHLIFPEESEPHAVTLMGLFIIIMLPLTVAVAVFGVKERKTPPPQHVPWKQAVKLLATSKPLQIILAVDLISGISGGIVASLFIFLASDALKLGSASDAMLLVYFISGVTFIPLIMILSRKFGKHKSVAFSALFSGATLPLILLIPEGNVPMAMACWVALGVNMGAGPFLFRSIMADVADHDAVQSGQQRTGLFYSLLTMTNKVGHAVAIGIAYAALDLIGFQAGGENSPEVIAGLKAVYVWPAFIIALACAYLIWRFPIDETKQLENRRILEARALDVAEAAIGSRTAATVDPRPTGAPAD